MNFKRLILKENSSQQKIETIAFDEGWFLYDFILPTEETPFEQIWMTSDEETSIHYIEDAMIGIRYIFVDGAEQEETVNQISSTMDVYTKDEICDMVKQAALPEEYANAIYHVGVITTHKYDPELFECFQITFTHSEPKVREAGIIATAYAGWREFEVPLMALKTNDPEPTVRELAEFTLQKLSEKNWK